MQRLSDSGSEAVYVYYDLISIVAKRAIYDS